MRSTAHYQQVLDLSQRMLAAGMAQRWDELVALEAQRRALLDQTEETSNAPATPADKALISAIQVCDAQLSEKLDAWLSHVRILLRLDKQSTN